MRLISTWPPGSKVTRACEANFGAAPSKAEDIATPTGAGGCVPGRAGIHSISTPTRPGLDGGVWGGANESATSLATSARVSGWVVSIAPRSVSVRRVGSQRPALRHQRRPAYGRQPSLRCSLSGVWGSRVGRPTADRANRMRSPSLVVGASPLECLRPPRPHRAKSRLRGRAKSTPQVDGGQNRAA